MTRPCASRGKSRGQSDLSEIAAIPAPASTCRVMRGFRKTGPVRNLPPETASVPPAGNADSARAKAWVLSAAAASPPKSRRSTRPAQGLGAELGIAARHSQTVPGCGLQALKEHAGRLGMATRQDPARCNVLQMPWHGLVLPEEDAIRRHKNGCRSRSHSQNADMGHRGDPSDWERPGGDLDRHPGCASAFDVFEHFLDDHDHVFGGSRRIDLPVGKHLQPVTHGRAHVGMLHERMDRGTGGFQNL